jgi:putative tryptophan/tyrosine transport system substrate-binding protein
VADLRTTVTAVRLRRIFALVALVGAAATPAQRLVVMSSSDSPPYQQALSGIEKSGLSVEALSSTAEGEAALEGAIARGGRDTAIVTLGARAAEIVARAAPAVPVVNCMVLNADPAKVPAGTIVVPLEIPFDNYLLWLKRLLPDAHNVGLLYDPAQNERRAGEAAAALKRAGYTPVLEAVSGPTALPGALRHFTNSADVLQALPDTTVFNGEHARALLLFSFRNHIPMAGPTEAWVRAGALYAVDWDYVDLGRYCAATAARQWSGGRTPVPLPPRTQVTVNLRSAEQLRIRWTPELLNQVSRVSE